MAVDRIVAPVEFELNSFKSFVSTGDNSVNNSLLKLKWMLCGRYIHVSSILWKIRKGHRAKRQTNIGGLIREEIKGNKVDRLFVLGMKELNFVHYSK